MTVLRNVLEALPESSVVFETFDRTGAVAGRITGEQLIACALQFRSSLDGLPLERSRSGRPSGLALLFKPEETIEMLVAAFAAMSRGITVVPLYPNWSAETQLEYLEAYRLKVVCTGPGFRSRAESWAQSPGLVVEQSLAVDLSTLLPSAADRAPRELPFDLSADDPCALIFTSGTSGKLAKLTEISLRNLEAAIENIKDLDFLTPGMSIHCPLSASHIFAFVAILGFLAVRPRRVIFSDVQYLQRLPEARTGKVDGLILVPIVINRMRAGFYERLVQKLDPRTVPPELKSLARIPLPARKLLKRLALRAERAVIDLETTGSTNPAGWAAVQLARKLFGKLFQSRLGSPGFVVVGGAKPNLQAMAFLEVMGIRCLQGWGMTETTGPLAVCRLGDRFRGAFGTCGTLFPRTKAYVEDGELVVEGPQIATGYHQPDGSFVAFNGQKRTGDHAEFDPAGRLRVLGKASDRITTENGLNYNPIPLEEDLHALDLLDRQLVEEAVVIGDAQPRLGAVFFLREGVARDEGTRAYLEALLRRFNDGRPVDERVGPWSWSDLPFKESGVLGPSGKLIRRRVEERFQHIFARDTELVS